jgi:hypothetical protein
MAKATTVSIPILICYQTPNACFVHDRTLVFGRRLYHPISRHNPGSFFLFSSHGIFSAPPVCNRWTRVCDLPLAYTMGIPT